MRAWINRQSLLIDYTLSSLGRHGGRNLGLFAVYAGIVFVLASTMLFTHAIRREAKALLAHSPEVLLLKLKAGRHAYLTRADLDGLGRLRGVSKVEGRRWGYFFDSLAGANYTLMAPSAGSPDRGRVDVGDGVAAGRGDTGAARAIGGADRGAQGLSGGAGDGQRLHRERRGDSGAGGARGCGVRGQAGACEHH